MRRPKFPLFLALLPVITGCAASSPPRATPDATEFRALPYAATFADLTPRGALPEEASTQSSGIIILRGSPEAVGHALANLARRQLAPEISPDDAPRSAILFIKFLRHTNSRGIVQNLRDQTSAGRFNDASFPPPTFTVDDRLNALVVTSDRRSEEANREAIDALDREPEPIP